MARLAAIALFTAAIVTPVADGQQKQPLTLQGYMADSYAMMRDFGRCAVVHESMAKFLEANGKPANAEQMRDFARGMLVAAQTGTYIDEAKLENPTSEQMRESEKRILANDKTLESLMTMETTRQKAFAERGEMDIEQMEFCVGLSKVTARIVETLRKNGAFN